MGHHMSTETRAMIHELLEKGYSRERIRNALHISISQLKLELRKTGKLMKAGRPKWGLVKTYRAIQKKGERGPVPFLGGIE